MASQNEKDPLDGYRRVERTPLERQEDELNALHRIENESGVDEALVREVIRSDNLIKAMAADKTLGKLVTGVTERLDAMTKVWSTSSLPTTPTCLAAHTEARACRLVIDWIEEIINNGAMAQQQLEAEPYESET